jgi:hypothetical protein
LEVYKVNALWLFLRWFVQHHTFPLITFNMFAHNHVATSIYVHYKVCIVDVVQLAIITKKNFTIQVWVITFWPALNT